MTRKEAVGWMLGGGLLCLAFSVSATAKQAKPDTKKQEALNKALIHAVRTHDVKTVRALLAQGADANAPDRDAKPDRSGALRLPSEKRVPTPLLIVFEDAVLSTKWAHDELKTRRRPDPADTVKALLDKGADPNVLSYDGRSPLLFAAQNKYAASARLLLEHGANVNQTWVHGITPLGIAAGNKDVPTVKILVANGADRTAQSAFDNPAHPLDEEVRKLLQQPKEQK